MKIIRNKHFNPLGIFKKDSSILNKKSNMIKMIVRKDSKRRFYSSGSKDVLICEDNNKNNKNVFVDQERYIDDEKIIQQAWDLFNKKCFYSKNECNDLLRQLMNKGNQLATIILWFNGELNSIELNDEEIENVLMESVNKTNKTYVDSLAIHYLGVMKENKSDWDNAIKYYEISSDLNNIASLTSLADLYLLGNKKIKKNISKAKAYLEKSAEMGSVDSLFSLYKIYMHNEKDSKKAMQYLEKASDLNDEDSTFILAQIYENGNNQIKRDINKSIIYYEKSSSLGNTTSSLKLANFYYKGTDGVEKDYNKAIFYYEKASTEGCRVGPFFNLGQIYSSGEGGIQKDMKKAVYFFQKAKDIQNVKNNNNVFHFYQSTDSQNKSPVVNQNIFS